jgi:hypothetical protein
MATRTPQRPASAGRLRRTTANTQTRRFNRPTTRRKPQPASNPLSALTNLLPTGGSKSAPKGKGGGKSKAGLAALAGVAGFALKNRSKITSRFGNKSTHGGPNQQF